MIERIVDFSTRNRLLVIFAVLIVGAMGVRAMRQLPIDAVPDVTNVQVQVLTNAPALGPLEVERFITFPVEAVMGGLPRLEQVRSVSQFGLSAVTVVFEEGTDIYFARQLVAERLSEAREAIPEGYGTPEMGPISTGLGEIFQFELKGENMCGEGGPNTDDCFTLMELRTMLDWYVAYQVRSVPGVVEVNSFGGELKTYEVQVDPSRLLAHRIALNEVFDALEENNGNAGGAYLIHAGEQRLIRGEGLLQNIQDIRDVVVTTREGGTPITVGDVAHVELAPMVRHGAVTADGRGEVVTGIVMMLMGANSREVSQAVAERLDEIRPTLPDGVTLETHYDRRLLVDRTIGTVVTNLLEGGILVIVVLLLLLGNLRGGLLVATAIPLSMLFAFIGMRWANVSGNLMSLGAIDFGLIVDGSVVIVEHIVFVLAQTRSKGDAVAAGVRRGAREVVRPVVFAVGIIMIVYVPILTLQGIEGKMFRPMAMTVLFALGGSLILALTLMPAAATFLFRKGVSEKDTWLIRQAKKLHEPVLHWAIRHRWSTFAAASLLLVAAGGIVPTLGAEFVPTLDEGAIAIQATRLPSVSLEESIEATSRIERTLRERFPDEVELVVSRTGRAEIATDPMGVELSDIFVILRPENEWRRARTKAELVELMSATLRDEVPGQGYAFSQPIELRTNELISGVRADVAINLYGDDLERLAQAGASIVDVVRQVDGAADVAIEQISGLPMLRVQVDRRAIARHGINASQVLDAVSAVGGRPSGEVFEGQRRFDLQVRYIPEARGNLEALRNIPIASAEGTRIPLGQLANLVVEEGPAQISRENVQRRVTIQTNVRGRDLAGFVEEARARISREVELPSGYFVEWGGQFENLQEATARLAIAVPAALSLIFVLLLMTYRSPRPALIIFLNVPFAATGGIIALALRGMPFSISAGVGFIALFGIAVLNGVVLISYIRRLQSDGESLADATTHGAIARLRPVLMTALVASLGFLPMAVSSTAGAEVQRPLATVVIGGLITSTLLTLFVLPAIYSKVGGELKAADSQLPREVADEPFLP